MLNSARFRVVPSSRLLTGTDDSHSGRTAQDLSKVVLLELSLPGESGPHQIGRSRDYFPEVLILALRIGGDAARGAESHYAGVCEYFLKHTPEMPPVESVREGSKVKSCKSPIQAVRETRPAGTADAQLTPHEVRLLNLLVEGHRYKTAAAALGVSSHTVSFHLRRLYLKLGVHSKAEAVSKAWRECLV